MVCFTIWHLSGCTLCSRAVVSLLALGATSGVGSEPRAIPFLSLMHQNWVLGFWCHPFLPLHVGVGV